MRPRTKQKAKNIAKTGAAGVRGIIVLILKIVGTFIIIGATTAVIFATIFTIYVKTNLTSQLDVTLEDFTLNLTTTLYYTDPVTKEDTELVQLQSKENRTWLNYSDIPKDVEHAVVAIEDKRFYDHHGVDWYRTTGAFFNMFLSMKNTFGGSTITQQLLKNITTEDEVTVQRKLLEIFRALELEKAYTKEQIVEWYLNVVYFGHGQYGIAAAANYYFGKLPSELSIAEVASIVGITNNPSLYSPFTNPENNQKRQRDILYEMYDQGYINETQYNKALVEKLNFQKGIDDIGEIVIYSYFVDAVIEDAIETIMDLKDCPYLLAQRFLFTGGYQIYTTYNPEIQACVDQIYTNLEEIPATTGSDQQLQSSIVIIDPYTGDIVALSGGVGEKTISRGINYATQGKRPPGSSFKPISAYAPAMDLGLITPDTLFEDSEHVTLSGTSWMPKNDDLKYTVGGIVSISDALRRSVNTVAAQLVDILSPQVCYNFLSQKLGLEGKFTSKEGFSDADYAPMAMGELSEGLSARDMAAAYTIFPNHGIWTESRTFTKISDSDGKVLYENIPDKNTAISETTAYWMTKMLTTAVTSGTGAGARLGNMPAAGKTGTSSGYQDRWFVGYTPYYVAAVWCGYKTPERIRISTGNPASQLWKKVMTLVHENLEYKDFDVPENTYLAPVPGVEPVEYFVRGVSDFGEILYETVSTSIIGREVSAEAQTVEGFTLISAPSASIIVTELAGENVIEFTYTSDEPPEPSEEPVDPTDPTEPTEPVDPTVPPGPVPTDDPTQPTPTDPGSSETPEGAPPV